MRVLDVLRVLGVAPETLNARWTAHGYEASLVLRCSQRTLDLAVARLNAGLGVSAGWLPALGG